MSKNSKRNAQARRNRRLAARKVASANGRAERLRKETSGKNPAKAARRKAKARELSEAERTTDPKTSIALELGSDITVRRVKEIGKLLGVTGYSRWTKVKMADAKAACRAAVEAM